MRLETQASALQPGRTGLMSEQADRVRAQAPTAQAATGRRAATGPGHEALDTRQEARTLREHRARLNRRPAVAAQRKGVESLAGRGAGPSPVQPAVAPNRTGLPDRLKNGVE